mmetsp:Transcript_19180/g.52681  ORF Transcript_19180/g.52681 Transcript_19180/m.52681 type:complete len:406 (-) Transcript_19180:113-1330(-)
MIVQDLFGNRFLFQQGQESSAEATEAEDLVALETFDDDDDSDGDDNDSSKKNTSTDLNKQQPEDGGGGGEDDTTIDTTTVSSSALLSSSEDDDDDDEDEDDEEETSQGGCSRMSSTSSSSSRSLVSISVIQEKDSPDEEVLTQLEVQIDTPQQEEHLSSSSNSSVTSPDPQDSTDDSTTRRQQQQRRVCFHHTIARVPAPHYLTETVCEQLWYSADELEHIEKDMVRIDALTLATDAVQQWAPTLSALYEQSAQFGITTSANTTTAAVRPTKKKTLGEDTTPPPSLAELRHQLVGIYADSGNVPTNDVTKDDYEDSSQESEPIMDVTNVLGLEQFLLNWFYQEETGADRVRGAILASCSSKGVDRVSAFQAQQHSRPFCWVAREYAVALAKVVQQQDAKESEATL